VALRTCTVAVKDIRDVEHSVEVNAETLYEAIATALAALQQDNWVGEIGQGLTTVTVVVQQPPVKHQVKLKDFLSWLNRQGRSPAEVILKQKLEKILGKVVARGRDRKE
jgi:LysM repeat protein